MTEAGWIPLSPNAPPTIHRFRIYGFAEPLEEGGFQVTDSEFHSAYWPHRPKWMPRWLHGRLFRLVTTSRPALSWPVESGS